MNGTISTGRDSIFNSIVTLGQGRLLTATTRAAGFALKLACGAFAPRVPRRADGLLRFFFVQTPLHSGMKGASSAQPLPCHEINP